MYQKKVPKGAMCDTMSVETLNPPHLKRCGKPATRVLRPGGYRMFDSYLCDECYESETKKERADETPD